MVNHCQTKNDSVNMSISRVFFPCRQGYPDITINKTDVLRKKIP